MYGTGPRSNSRPIDLQSGSHLLPDTLPTALRGPMMALVMKLTLWITTSMIAASFMTALDDDINDDVDGDDYDGERCVCLNYKKGYFLIA